MVLRCFTASTASLSVTTVRDAAIAMRQAMIDTVDEVGRVQQRRGHRLRLRQGRR
jgi:hypothetical protein